MAGPRGGALRPALVALLPVGLLAAASLAAVAIGSDAPAVGLAVVAAGIVVAVACGLALAGGWRRRLEGLARAAGAADTALDDAARALAEGRPIDARADVPPDGRAAVAGGSTGGGSGGAGTDAVAAAAATLERLVGTSTRLLAEEGGRRRAIADLFVNVGRRNQNLVSRQLKLLDRLEEGETDPEALAALFRLDHLSTRMRRNAESLLVVAGLEPPRRWRQPVPIREVARAAAAESEEFERVELGTFPVVALGGDVVATIVHLLAELIDNGIRFSPPDTPVTVRAALDGEDLAVVVADTGVGMAQAAVAQANAQLAAGAPERADIPAAQLGLYVVGRLAARAGITVCLESTGGDGVNATVRIPPRLLEAAPTSAVSSSTPEDARRTVAAAERAAATTGPTTSSSSPTPASSTSSSTSSPPTSSSSTSSPPTTSSSSATAPAGRRPAAGSPRRLANGAHRVEGRPPVGERPRPIRPDAPPRVPPAETEPVQERAVDPPAATPADRNGSAAGDRTASGFRRRQPKAAAPEHERRSPSRLRAPDPTSADERRDRLERFSAGKATAEEVMSLRDSSADAAAGGSSAGEDAGAPTGEDAAPGVEGTATGVPGGPAAPAARRDGDGSRRNGTGADGRADDGGAVGGEAG